MNDHRVKFTGFRRLSRVRQENGSLLSPRKRKKKLKNILVSRNGQKVASGNPASMVNCGSIPWPNGFENALLSHLARPL